MPLSLQQLQWLRDCDARIDSASPQRATLDPTRARAHSLVDVAGSQTPGLPASFVGPYVSGLCELALAQLEHFPGNIFWDFDFVGAQILRQAQSQERRGAVKITELFSLMSELQRLYGRSTAIRFRYVHDFSYGYDWAKWVARSPGERGEVQPFDERFLEHMQRRGHELLELIAINDAKYPRLDSPRARNPFPFSREPDAEFRLHRELASRGQLPVQTWNANARPRWAEAFAETRVSCAEELGLALELEA